MFHTAQESIKSNNITKYETFKLQKKNNGQVTQNKYDIHKHNDNMLSLI